MGLDLKRKNYQAVNNCNRFRRFKVGCVGASE